MDNHEKEIDVGISLTLSIDQFKAIFIALYTMVDDLSMINDNYTNLTNQDKEDFKDLRSISKFLLSSFFDIFSVVDQEFFESVQYDVENVFRK